MGIFKFIRELTAEKLAVITSLFGAGIVVLASSDLKLALAVSLLFTVALTASSAVTSAVRYLTGQEGRRTVYISVSAGICALSTVIVSNTAPEILERFLTVAVMIPVSAAFTENCPERESVLYGAVRSFAVGVIYALMIVSMATLRALIGAHEVWLGFILLGISYAFMRYATSLSKKIIDARAEK